jgi:hypothetical protein
MPTTSAAAATAAMVPRETRPLWRYSDIDLAGT